MKTPIFATLASLAMLVIAFPATAFSCSDAAMDIGGVLYLDARAVPTAENPTFYSVWIYAETNGIPGLQRGGSEVVFETTGQQATATMIGETDPDCTSAVPDTLIL